MTTITTSPLVVVDEHAAAPALGMSVHWLRKDRTTTRIVPFVKLGTRVRYDLTRCHLALAAREQGGVVAAIA